MDHIHMSGVPCQCCLTWLGLMAMFLHLQASMNRSGTNIPRTMGAEAARLSYRDVILDYELVIGTGDGNQKSLIVRYTLAKVLKSKLPRSSCRWKSLRPETHAIRS